MKIHRPNSTPPPAAGVRAWEQPLTIPTYAAGAPEPYPMFLETRVYQGSSGRVYPQPITERIADGKTEREYRAVYLENEYVQLLILPEIGGRIHAGLDKTNQYDFFYRQRVIKPALVGLLGPWISGGVEFNWPQHHRPSTFMPAHAAIEERADGGRTVWLGEHDPMERMSCRLGITLWPSKSLIEAQAHIFNRTRQTQSFLWWANAAVHVHDEYQAFFPPDVAWVADHARRAVTRYPIARGIYYGVDYRPGTDISWWRNIPAPTSYMVTASNYDFMGGYDHRRQAGVVAIADRHIAPGKKLWTWGNSEFGRAWERNLTDADGPYIELMLGAYTDNQPDFSWLRPYESREFAHYWYPIQRIGPVKNANRRLAVNLEVEAGRARAGVCASERIAARVELCAASGRLWEEECEIAPGRPFVREFEPASGRAPEEYLLRVLDGEGRELIRYRPLPPVDAAPPADGGREGKGRAKAIAARCDGATAQATPATEPPPPAEVASNDELYLTGMHLEQYRHATRAPEPYWQEAVRRDGGDNRAHLALGRRRLRQGEFSAALEHFQAAIARLTARNSNPDEGEVFYQLGVALHHLGRDDEAYIAFYKAAWNAAWRGAAFYSLAEIAARRGELAAALEHLDHSLAANAANFKARNLKTALLRHSGETEAARRLAAEAMASDWLNPGARHEARLLGIAAASAPGAAPPAPGRLQIHMAALDADFQLALDAAFDYAAAGLWQEARDLLLPHGRAERPHPMALYASGYFAAQAGEAAAARACYRRAGEAPADYCFPARLDEMLVLEAALAALDDPAGAENNDSGAARAAELRAAARAHYYLGNLYYDKRRREDAARHWAEAARLAPEFAPAWRNLAIAAYRLRYPPEEIRNYSRQAFTAGQKDSPPAAATQARLLEELDQLEKRLGAAPADRLERLERFPQLLAERDTLALERAALLLRLDRPQAALEQLAARRYHPWEGGEGLASEVYTQAHLRLAQAAREAGAAANALEHCRAARRLPENLGEFRHPLASLAAVDYQAALAHQALGQADEARADFERAAAAVEAAPAASDYWRALALRALGREAEARACLERLREFARARRAAPGKPDYFATSAPDFSVFPQDLSMAHAIEADWLEALALLGFNQRKEARRGLEAVLRLDPSHPAAAFLRELEAASG